MKLFARGQRSRLDALTSSLDLRVGVKIDAPGLTIDFSCFGVDEAGVLSDDRFFVFYNQPVAPAQAIALEGRGQDDESFRVRLENLLPGIRRLVFTATIDGAGSMAQIRSGYLRLGEASGSEIVRYEFKSSDFAGESALMLAELYWKDAWRFGAVGQGFVGNLSALLKHFGGVEIADNAASSNAAPPANAPNPPPAMSPAPLSPATPIVSTSMAPPIAPPLVASSVEHASSLQSLIDAAPTGGVVQIGRGEFAGPVTIRRAVSLQGSGGVIWATCGPVVTVESPNVSLSDVEIEVTAPQSEAEDVALLAQASTFPALHNLRVRGRVVGTSEDGGAWNLPHSLDLGLFAPRGENSFEIALDVPVACALSCSVVGLSVQPAQLEPGSHRVRLVAREVPPESFVCGEVLVHAGQVARAIALSGRAGPLGTPPAQGRALPF